MVQLVVAALLGRKAKADNLGPLGLLEARALWGLLARMVLGVRWEFQA